VSAGDVLITAGLETMRIVSGVPKLEIKNNIERQGANPMALVAWIHELDSPHRAGFLLSG